ncbi:MAG: (2Fe-2S)-binding protein [Intrasporangium sp.]|uniref:(2Fe-2S)-binding protein n=1 Tax=Intrasporangium sp. TaxID=1925024 RepID=UPI0026497AFD|nr:(2Fe-2S)-binding protein [Intrasporangium sp.]MDN5795188.1 (2Fe-2S)-binding protein [Intrasporangium sp.]
MSTFEFDGAGIEFRPGQTIGAALVAAGQVSWRTTRVGGVRRGLFCGIGICFDCLVTVEGEPNQRACLVVAEPGLTVTTQEGTGHEHD